jgi:hypothetical protein
VIATARQSAAQTLAFAFGAWFLVLGVLGFVPGVTQNVDSIELAGVESDAELLGIFELSVLHNAIHLAFASGLVMARTPRAARGFLLVGAIFYAALFAVRGSRRRQRQRELHSDELGERRLAPRLRSCVRRCVRICAPRVSCHRRGVAGSRCPAPSLRVQRRAQSAVQLRQRHRLEEVRRRAEVVRHPLFRVDARADRRHVGVSLPHGAGDRNRLRRAGLGRSRGGG